MPPNSPGEAKCTSLHKKLLNTIESLKKLYESGPFLEKLDRLLPLVDIIDMKSFLLMNLVQLEKKLYMLGSLPQNKKMTLNIKLNLLNKNFLTTKSLKILGLDLILKDGDLSPFWNESSEVMSKKLLLPTMTDLQELDLASFSSSANTSIQNLQFCQIKTIGQLNQSSMRNLFQSSHITQPNSMECVNIKYCRKIKFYPTKPQIEYFQKCFGTTRYLYNKTIKMYNQEKFNLNIVSARSIIMKNNKDMNNEDPEKWLIDIPYDTRQLAISAALDAIKSSFALLKNGHINKFSMRMKTKKDKKQVFYVNDKAIKNLNLFPKKLNDHSKLIVNNKYKKYYNYIPESDCIIQKDGFNYYILIPKEKEIKIEKERKENIVSLDPGIRTFQSFYTPDGIVGDLGNQQLKNKIMKYENKIDILKSINQKLRNQNINSNIKRKILKIERKCFKLKTKVLNIIKDFQWKVSSFLCKTYKVVLLPIFKSQELKNNLNRKNNRLLDLLSHYKFQEKMKHQAIKYNCDLKIVTEEYTTKTCGKCGCINNFIGSSKIFWCNKCNVTLERDYQAARNILIKFKCQGSDAYPLRGT